MNGMEAARKFFNEYGLPVIRMQYQGKADFIAAGLVGQGSECFGFDDELSRDHDFGPGFCLWIPDRYASQLKNELQRTYDTLVSEYDEESSSIITDARKDRVGVKTISEFYLCHIGMSRAPVTPMEWLGIPQRYFAETVNGEVFFDPLGEFSEIRSKLLDFYPEDALKKKLAANCYVMAQAGQYNYARCIKRKAFNAAYLAEGEFIKAAISAVYLLNGTYTPFYKWSFRGLENLSEMHECISDLNAMIFLDVTDGESKSQMIEKICFKIAEELVSRGWSDRGDSFMVYHAKKLMKSISDPQVAKLNIMACGN